MKKLLLAMVAIPLMTLATDFQSQLAGKRLILDGANCAGLEISNDKQTAVWRNEIECMKFNEYVSNWRIKWLNDKIFVLIELEQTDDNRAPRNRIYEVISMDKNTARFIHYWTGWGESDDDVELYRIK